MVHQLALATRTGLLVSALLLVWLAGCTPSNQGFVVTITPSPVNVVVGDSASAVVTVTQGGTPAAGVSVTLTVGSTSRATVMPGTATTSAQGTVQAQVDGLSAGSTELTATVSGGARDTVTVNVLQPAGPTG